MSGYYGASPRHARNTRDLTHSEMTSPKQSSAPATPSFRTTLIRVMAVQVATVLLLWLLQSHYTS